MQNKVNEIINLMKKMKGSALMKLSTAEIKVLILECIKGKDVCGINDFKKYISMKSNKEYTIGQISGAIRQLTEMGKIENIERGVYREKNKQDEYDIEGQECEGFRYQIAQCLIQAERQLEQIVSEINVLKLTSKDFEFLGEIKYLNDQIKNIREKCKK